MMLKERIVDRYGEIRYTFGQGGSGGSIGQHMVANSYPGPPAGPDGRRSRSPTTPARPGWRCRTATCSSTTTRRCRRSSGRPGAAGGGERRTAIRVHVRRVGGALRRGRRPAQRLRRRRRARLATTTRTRTRPAAAARTRDFQFPIWGPRPPSVWNQAEQALGRGFARCLRQHRRPVRAQAAAGRARSRPSSSST